MLSTRSYLPSTLSKSLLLIIVSFILGSSFQPGMASAQPTRKSRFSRYSSNTLQIKFKNNTDVNLVGNNFSGPETNDVNLLLARSKASNKRQLFRDSNLSLKSRYHDLNTKGFNVNDLSQYYEIKLPNGTDIQAVSDQLKSLPNVEDAYPEPSPAPAPVVSPDFTNLELYRTAAPGGINTNFASTWPGGKGGQVKIIDLEYSWNTAHEDLSKSRANGALIPNGTPADPFNDNNHGTAVLGIMSGDENSYGVTGIVPNASLNLVNTYSSDGGWDVANAIYTASAHMNAGDVMTIEQQAYGPSSDPNAFVPIEWIPSVYDAIKYATANNITVVEPAGNGSQNLDDTSLYGTSFPASKPDSGAIIVGASAACAGGSPQRSRLGFSNYGKRVNLQGLGECVATTGYGDLFGSTVNSYYTNHFNGTSSATPIVAGAAASFISSYKYLNGVAPTAALVRSTLQSTGTAQNFAVGALTGDIGPLPNLASALLKSDLKAPTAPTKLSSTLNSSNKVVLKWTAATDNVGVTSYRIYRNNVLIKTLASPAITFTDTTTTAKKTYQYKMTAVDKSGRVSVYSNTVFITTK